MCVCVLARGLTCMSSPVTIFPTVLNAGVCTLGCACMSKSTNLLGTPVSITA